MVVVAVRGVSLKLKMTKRYDKTMKYKIPTLSMWQWLIYHQYFIKRKNKSYDISRLQDFQHMRHVSITKWLKMGTYCYIAKNNSVRKVITGLAHHSDVIMGAMASQMTSLSIVYSTVYTGADQRKHQGSASLAFVWGIHRWPVNSLHKGPVTRKIFPFWWRHHVLSGPGILWIICRPFLHCYDYRGCEGRVSPRGCCCCRK